MPVTISQAIAGVQADLTEAGVVSVSGVQHWTADQATRFDANVRALQCAQHTSDPVVAMIAGPVTMDLSGTFSQSGSFSVSASSAAPVFGLQADASRTKGQTLNVPVQFVPLSALADAEAGREVGYAGALLVQNDQVRQAVAALIEADRAALGAHVELLVSDPTRCPGTEIRPFIGGKKRERMTAMGVNRMSGYERNCRYSDIPFNSYESKKHSLDLNKTRNNLNSHRHP
ncbi:hypothetical protein [Gluconobacter kanchanaburiensis]|uniref:Uncharacterized protein n=1 Tax=Gluconobacter kanchanaburiensis NBRC 103587 TaxID=1307948 RepID=A0A511B604_9PROT|nr:hypothetical protein [Gluconobacter kanchanaburiensis]GBR71023.1 hypothetical protein AA103587_2178 [Gluconobacter kanchanaburiensis NBRC 103587]GEK95885.1 hypothetical protein GKA01_10820 [Gluconobacter kanchanaburiensis NBRC 103587]